MVANVERSWKIINKGKNKGKQIQNRGKGTILRQREGNKFKTNWARLRVLWHYMLNEQELRKRVRVYKH